MNSSTSLPMGGSQKQTSGRKRRREHQSDPTKNPLGTSGYRESMNKKGSCAKSRENGVITNFRVNAKIKGERRGHQFSCKCKTRREHKVVRALAHYLQKKSIFRKAVRSQRKSPRIRGAGGTHPYSFAYPAKNKNKRAGWQGHTPSFF